jgi:hypothetical protein
MVMQVVKNVFVACDTKLSVRNYTQAASGFPLCFSILMEGDVPWQIEYGEADL